MKVLGLGWTGCRCGLVTFPGVIIVLNKVFSFCLLLLMIYCNKLGTGLAGATAAINGLYLTCLFESFYYLVGYLLVYRVVGSYGDLEPEEGLF